MIVVTGGAGFIGGNLVSGLNAAGEDRIIVVDNLTNGRKHRNLSGLSFRDYVDKDDFLTQLHKFSGISAILHQGACAVTTEMDGRFMMRNNYDYSKQVLDFCLSKGIPFIYASSASVYGDGKKGFTENPACENPLNVYAFSKLVFDNHVRSLLRGAESCIVGLRYFNVYGPREAHKGDMASLPFKMFNQHQRNEPLRLFQSSENYRRDFIHVDDVVAINLSALARRHSGIFNCGTGTARSFRALANLMVDNLQGAVLEEIEMPASLKAQYQTYTCSENAHLFASGYGREFKKLDEGIAEYVSWLRVQS